mmetsp:Transcript_56358/g.123484  ORF Transcript_56358/g.123484 Transcript_56358/m.123484 type:complete len:252 (+) Transcript_56358:233-988(+)|eukprot:CAMPEP_0204374002 /NCGR_PEP_ID=MMETSP0469-20131031/48399_1 /ASSEMBLY_ACC=CAM_ASM_000384 /TAXON_ID=2969 /ORGANISM="Oxyrrhis marina" /LENGTH=251 /DNA_ID=CAMNT_0051364537 /DNA_START=211 /DNA_END=966 /DNA_ORIENTATION=-
MQVSQRTTGVEAQWWVAFCAVVVAVVPVVSDGHLSVFLTLGAGCQLFGVVRMLAERSTEGLSTTSLQLTCLALAARLVALWGAPVYLPVDSSGDVVYPALLACSLAGAVALLAAGGRKPAEEPGQRGIVEAVVGCALVALVMHPHLSARTEYNCCWAFATFLEALACLPQLTLTAHHQRCPAPLATLAATAALAAGAQLVFWAEAFDHVGCLAGGCATLAVLVVQLGLMAQFLVSVGAASGPAWCDVLRCA